MGYNSWVSSWPSFLSCLTLDNHLSATLCLHLFLSLKSAGCVCVCVWAGGVGGFSKSSSGTLKEKSFIVLFPGIAEAADNRH